jgi:hypothetical protein
LGVCRGWPHDSGGLVVMYWACCFLEILRAALLCLEGEMAERPSLGELRMSEFIFIFYLLLLLLLLLFSFAFIL